MNEEQVLTILQQHVPPAAVGYCFSLWQEKPFRLKLTKNRQTKLGDFTSHSPTAHPRITLNHDLNPFAFLITYIHEVAHWHVHLAWKTSCEPHGVEWKQSFQTLMNPLLTCAVFPEHLHQVLVHHMRNPKASTYADPRLTKSLRQYDAHSQAITILSELPEGSIFKLHTRYFKKGKLRRTRVLCCEIHSKRQYLVPADAQVSDVQLSLL